MAKYNTELYELVIDVLFCVKTWKEQWVEKENILQKFGNEFVFI